jgi:uncharacterized membrane protein
MVLDDLLRAELGAPVAPWSYNPSRWSQRIPICILAAVAFLIAAYMALYQWRLIGSVWDPVFGDQSQQVLDSNVAQTMDRWIGVPDAAFGAFAYLGDAILGLAGSTRRWQFRPWLVVLFGIDVIPLGIVSSVLVALQATVVGKWCFLCIVTAAISLILAWWAYDEVYSSLKYLYRVWQRSKSVRVLWDTFWGIPSELAYEVGNEMVQASNRRSKSAGDSAA